jgi:hypothetical protein
MPNPTPPKPNAKKPTPPKKPGDAEIDIDDAQIEPAKDDAFRSKEPKEDNTTSRLKEREK